LAKKVPKVFYTNTRFDKVPFKGETPASSSKSSGTSNILKRPSTKIGVDGKELETDTPKVNGFSFVRTPSPTPGKHI
jgi:protein DGCR14